MTMPKWPSRCEEKRVLHVVPRWDLGMGGVKRFILNASSALDHRPYKCRVLSIGAVEGDGLGLEVESLISKHANPLDLVLASNVLCARIRDISPDVVHIHGNNGVALLYAEVAQRAGVTMRVVHSHNSSLGSDELCKHFADVALKRRFADAPTDRVACSRAAGDWLFGSKPYSIVRNGIDVSRFAFSTEDRCITRNQLGIAEGAIALVLVGAGIPVKNTLFALSILGKLRNTSIDTHLVLVGEGSETSSLREEARSMGVLPFVHFVGTVGDVWRYYSAADVLLMPSFYEGLPISLVEAQANGLPCAVSEAVSREADVAGLIEYLPLDCGGIWERTILTLAERGASRDEGGSEHSAAAVCTAGFSLEDLGAQLDMLYKGCGI